MTAQQPIPVRPLVRTTRMAPTRRPYLRMHIQVKRERLLQTPVPTPQPRQTPRRTSIRTRPILIRRIPRTLPRRSTSAPLQKRTNETTRPEIALPLRLKRLGRATPPPSRQMVSVLTNTVPRHERITRTRQELRHGLTTVTRVEALIVLKGITPATKKRERT